MNGVITAILAVFSGVAEWFSTAVTAMIPMFWVEAESGTGELTFLGALAVASLAIAVTLLLIRMIREFLSFRG